MGISGAETGATYRRADGMLTAAINDELVMMSVELGHYFSLNPIGARIWELLESPQSFEAIVETLIGEYEGEAEVIRSEVRAFLARLEKEGLVKRAAA